MFVSCIGRGEKEMKLLFVNGEKRKIVGSKKLWRGKNELFWC